MSDKIRMEVDKEDNDMILKSEWIVPSTVNIEEITKGDMPGDKIHIESQHLEKSLAIFRNLQDEVTNIMKNKTVQRAVISVYGGSGVGKSEIGSLLGDYFKYNSIPTYVLSGDNYPHRIPKLNDAERIRVFRETGLKGLIKSGQYSTDINKIITELIKNDEDYAPNNCLNYPWLSIYQEAGKVGLTKYLGTPAEIDFEEISHIIEQFKEGADSILLKRMGREENEVWYESIDFSQTKVIIIEWTHGNNDNLKGVDIPIFLHSSPQETLMHRMKRNRDGSIDSPFTTLVLGIEQDLLFSQASNAKLIVMKNGDIISCAEYMKRMELLSLKGDKNDQE